MVWSEQEHKDPTSRRQVLVTQRLIVEMLGIPRHVTECRVLMGESTEKRFKGRLNLQISI
jgi:hypothetical protein